MYTEDESTTKDCCNSDLEYPYNRRCSGSNCMAWRWLLSDVNKETPIGTFVRVVDGVEKTTTHGYCGLAGKP